MEKGEVCPEDNDEVEDEVEEAEEADDGKLGRASANDGVDDSWVCEINSGGQEEILSIAS